MNNTANTSVSATKTDEDSSIELTESIPSMDDYKDYISSSFAKHEVGDLMTGTVIGISETEVIIDLGSYVEGIIKLEELSNDPRFSIKTDIAIGDSVTTIMLREDKEGNLLFSKKQAEDILAWKQLKEMMNSHTVSRVKTAQAVNGGVTTYLQGIKAFIPASQLSSSYVDDVSLFVNKELDVTVLSVDEERQKLVLSAKEVLREEESVAKTQRINNLIPGTIVTGKVEKIMPFGAFVAIGNGLSGLVHISQICEKRLKSPNEVLKEGDDVTVKLLEVKDGKISLSIKAVAEDAHAEHLEEPPLEYSSGESVSTGLGALLAGLKIK